MTAQARPTTRDASRDARREAILDVASDVFLSEGYSAASMSTIAAKVGGSKATLYTYFKSKEELFEAYVRRHCAAHRDEMWAMPTDGEDLLTALTRLGKGYLRIVMSDRSLRHFRMITAEAERWPEIGHVFYESGPASGAARLAGFLSDMTAKGQLRIDDPLQAAHQFIALCQNRMLKARLCAAEPAPTEEQITSDVKAAVAVFLAAYSGR